MQITKTITTSTMRENVREVSQDVNNGDVIEVTSRSNPNEPMVLMTKADFLKLAKKAQQ